jgi:hypothetical protein
MTTRGHSKPYKKQGLFAAMTAGPKPTLTKPHKS